MDKVILSTNNDFYNFFDNKIYLSSNKIIQLENLLIDSTLFKIVNKLKVVSFINCKFNVSFDFEDNKRLYFESCEFNIKQNIKNCKTIKENNAIFYKCEFKQQVELINQIMGETVFDCCKIEQLIVKDTTFKKYLFFDSLIGLFHKKEFLTDYNYISLYKCIFHKDFFIGYKSKIETLNISSCDFLDEVKLHLQHPIKRIEIRYSSFEKTVNLSDNIINHELEICNSRFLSDLNLDNLKIRDLTLKEDEFLKKCSFFNVEIKKLFLYSTSFEYLNMKNCLVSNGLDLEKTSFIYKSHFFGLKGTIINRETARIIKDSFEQQNNIIEANKFYALEMKEREKELNDDIKRGKNIFEWLVFKIHGLASNHSQDWILSFLWIIIITLGYTFLGSLEFYILDKSEYIFKEIFISILVVLLIYLSITFLFSYSKTKIIFFISQISLLFYLFFTNDIYFKEFADNINPFSILTGTYDFSILTLLYKISITYLIYQLIISIRQNTRRK